MFRNVNEQGKDDEIDVETSPNRTGFERRQPLKALKTNSFRYHVSPKMKIAECPNHRKQRVAGNRKIMAFSHDFDPANGFVALPSDVMDIEMSPGAFRLLVELCRMANRSGECWPSLAQLSDRIGRSKAAISGYIKELREIELLQTASQKMANGYNYRLKYCVKFWQSWRAQLAQPTQKKVAQKTERSVQPSERRVNSKNNIHKNNSPETKTAEITKLESVFLEWTKLSKAAPFPSFNDTVPVELIEETK